MRAVKSEICATKWPVESRLDSPSYGDSTFRPWLACGLECEFQANCFGNGVKGGKERIPFRRQCAIKTLSPNVGNSRDFVHTISLREMAQGDKDHTRFICISENGFYVLSGKPRVPTNPANHCLIVRHTHFPFYLFLHSGLAVAEVRIPYGSSRTTGRAGFLTDATRDDLMA